jgi:RimJ/RimL family protein N-acetyltransferase
LNPVELARLEFSSERLILRSLRECDEELYCQLFCDPDTMRYIGPAWTRAAAARAFHGALEALRATPPRGLFLVLSLQADERPVGLCTLQNFEPVERRAELGMMLVPSGRAARVATEALIAVLAQAFAALPFDEIWVRFAIHHEAATRTALGGGLVRHARGTPEDLAASLWRWSAHRASWRPGERQGAVSVHCSAAEK